MEKKPSFFARRAILILVVVFFLVPFAMRGARMAVMGMKNDVKDWLPKDFDETRDLDDFRRHFLSEQFVLVSWDGCRGDMSDERFRLFVAKLQPETPPSEAAKPAEPAAATVPAESDSAEGTEAEEAANNPNPTRYLHQDRDFIGDRLGLYQAGNKPGDWRENWGDRNEKWLRGLKLDREGSNEECWYYITPEGELYRWNDVDSPFAALVRLIYRAAVTKKVEGTLVHAFGPKDGPWYHADPRRLRAQLFKTVATGPDVLESMTREGGELAGDPEEAHRRLAGTLFGLDQQTTCIMLTLTDAARRNLHLVVGRGMLGKPRGRLYEIAAETNIPEDELRMGGPPVDNVAIDEEGSITLVRLVGLSALIGITLSLACFRSISATIMIFFVGGIAAMMSLAFVWFCGSSVDAIMMSMPSLVYVLGLSGAAHIINYYHEAVDEHGHEGACERAIGHGWKPALLCNVTTAIGLISLVTSELVPIQKFGLFSALGVMATLLVLFTYLPAALQIWPQTSRKKKAAGQQSWLDRKLSGFWGKFGGFIVDHHGVVAVGCTVIIVAFSYGLVHMRTSVSLLRMFHADAKIIKDYEWLEANLGQLVPMEIVLRVPRIDQCPANAQLRELRQELAVDSTTDVRKAEIQQILGDAQFQLPFLERMELAARVQNVIEEEFGPDGHQVVGRALSAATFVRPLPKPGGSTLAHSVRSSTSGRLEAHRDDFLHSDYLRIDERDQTELWRVSLRLGATDGVDYGSFVTKLQETVEPVLAAQRERLAILRAVAGVNEENAGSVKSVTGAKVLLLGVPAGSLAAAKAEGEESSDSAAGAPAAVARTAAEKEAAIAAAPIDQDRIFVRALRDLLTNSRLNVKVHTPNGQPLPVEFAGELGNYDCIVLVKDDPVYNLAALQSAGTSFIDARDHGFVASQQQTHYQIEPASISAVYTGVVPIVYKAQRMLLDSLVQSTFWSVIMITPLLMYIARSFSAGLVAMLPNVLPILMVFGGMGWLGIDVDVGSMMTASIALGVAVDDTIHYLNWFREELDRLGDRKKAILAAYQHCATPTLQAATISGIGLSIFAISTFTPTQRFGMLMLVILWLGVVAELIFFPALLAGPLGMVFKPRKKVAGKQPDAHTAGPPHLVVVSDEEPVGIAAAVDVDDQSGIPAPHTVPARSVSPRSLRQDTPHRPRG